MRRRASVLSKAVLTLILADTTDKGGSRLRRQRKRAARDDDTGMTMRWIQPL